MNRFMIQVTDTYGSWIDIAGYKEPPVITDALLHTAGVVKGETYRLYDRLTYDATKEGVR